MSDETVLTLKFMKDHESSYYYCFGYMNPEDVIEELQSIYNLTCSPKKIRYVRKGTQYLTKVLASDTILLP